MNGKGNIKRVKWVCKVCEPEEPCVLTTISEEEEIVFLVPPTECPHRCSHVVKESGRGKIAEWSEMIIGDVDDDDFIMEEVEESFMPEPDANMVVIGLELYLNGLIGALDIDADEVKRLAYTITEMTEAEGYHPATFMASAFVLALTSIWSMDEIGRLC